MSDSDYDSEELSDMEQLGSEDADEEEQLIAGVSDDEAEAEAEDDEDAGAGARPAARQPVYDVDVLHEKLEDIAWADDVGWEETRAVTGAAATQVDDVDNDLERELAFYNQALAATVEAIGRFEGAGMPWFRPPDYYAEMVKSDEHMNKIKDKLMYEQQQIDQAAERRKAREQKQYAKQMQAEKQRERAAEKKKQIGQVQQLRKQRAKQGFAGELDFDQEMAAMDRRSQQQQQRPGQKMGQRIRADKRAPNAKRQAKDAKFGFGGRKRLQKQNDAASAADMSGFKRQRPDAKFGPKGGVRKGGGGGGAAKGKKAGKKQRPGKARRQQAKGGRV